LHLEGKTSMLKRLIVIVVLLLLTLNVGTLLAQDAPAEVTGEVIRMSTTLNLRAAPSPVGEVIIELTSGTPLTVLGRTATEGWLRVRTAEGQQGWVASGYVTLTVDIATLPVLTPDAVPVTTATTSETADDTVTDTDDSDTAVPVSGDSFVRAVSLNLRAAPSTRAAIIAVLPNRTALTLLARSANRAWLKVQTEDGLNGWVSASYVQTSVDLSSLEVDEAPVDVPSVAMTAPASTTPSSGAPVTSTNVVSGIGSTTLSIFRAGQQAGNRADVFSKFGDSITQSSDFLDPLGRGIYNLGSYGSLQSVIDFYLQSDLNSFTNVSLAAGAGWTTATVLDSNAADQSLCQPGETPLACELRLTKPAVALIMFGSNDVRFLDSATYAYNLQQIVQITKDAGVIPVVSTIPTVVGYEAQVNQFNGIVREIAGTNAIPLWDYATVMGGLPNSGLSGDGLHPSTAPSGYAGAADFNGENLQAGYVVRNLTALQALDALYRQVLTR
jgi:uncharacterized protein YraI/lysophospholipase L1-like esterase